MSSSPADIKDQQTTNPAISLRICYQLGKIGTETQLNLEEIQYTLVQILPKEPISLVEPARIFILDEAGRTMLRLFAAIPIPSQITADLAKAKKPLPGARWIEADDLHLTLRFAGDIDNRTAAEFADFLGRIQVNVFQLRMGGLGVFGGNEPRVLWAGVEPSTELDGLQRATEQAARSAGLKPESRQFKPHVTIARLRYTQPDQVSSFLQRHTTANSREFTVDHFALYSAKPRTGGGPYVVEQRFPLVGSYWPDDMAFDDAEDYDGNWNATT